MLAMFILLLRRSTIYSCSADSDFQRDSSKIVHQTSRRVARPRHRRVRSCTPARVSISWDAMFTLYSMQRSGNSYKARLALAQLGIPYRLVEIDILKGESHTPEFLTKESERPGSAS